ncbi:MAG TPA: GspE/PulE family protein [Armatimonadaceae bacterium]|nr:GspE/PulE family protein [Armatimonadaceae bacterium]
MRQTRRRLGERLVETGLITLAQLTDALEVQAKQGGGYLGQILVDQGIVPSREMGKILQELTGVAYVDLAGFEADPATARLLPENLIRERKILPVRADDKTIWLAMEDPLDLDVIDAVHLQTNRSVNPLLALPGDLTAAINRSFDVRDRANELIREIGGLGDAEAESEKDLLDRAEDAPIVRLVNTIVDGAFETSASDIHLEPQEDGLRVRYRVDGVLYEQMVLPRANQAAVVSRIKVIAGMDIAERRRPQDGRISRRHQGHSFDLRVSTMPTVHGEKAVLRVLDKSAMSVSLEQIGFLPDELQVWTHLITRPYGMVLVTGPTGSGKSTTLYSSLNKINDPGKNIATIEDPVEYRLKGVNQTQVNARAGVSFAAGLRTLMRQDPDIILVGEIRDQETAEVAINAALTGHLVFATLHTNDAPSAMTRLDNMGIEPFLITSSILGVVGQRLLRKVCDKCKEWYDADSSFLASLEIPVTRKDGAPTQLARGKGCPECSGKGYRGRVAVFEVMTVTDTVRAMVLRRESSTTVKDQAIADGMRPMRSSAMLKVGMGITTPDEVARVILAEED